MSTGTVGGHAVTNLGFFNHHLYIAFQSFDSERFSEEPKLFHANRVIDIENDTRSKCRHIELINLHITKKEVEM